MNATSQLVPADFSNVLGVYVSDLPSASFFDTELDIWQNKWSSSPERELEKDLNSLEKVLAHTDYDYFPNIHNLLVTLLTSPVTSCDANDPSVCYNS